MDFWKKLAKLAKTTRTDWMQVCPLETDEIDWQQYPKVIVDDILQRLSGLAACCEGGLTLWFHNAERECGKKLATELMQNGMMAPKLIRLSLTKVSKDKKEEKGRASAMESQANKLMGIQGDNSGKSSKKQKLTTIQLLL